MASSAHTTSRRNFLAVAGLASAAIVTPLAVTAATPTPKPDDVSDALKQAGVAIDTAFAAHADADSKIWTARTALRDWERANPEPKMAEDYEVRDGETVTEAYERERRALGIVRREWAARRTEFLKSNSVARLQTSANEATAVFERLVGDFAEMPASNMAEILFKADVAWGLDPDHNAIAASVVRDLIDLKQAAA
jgi:hypothetical protein